MIGLSDAGVATGIREAGARRGIRFRVLTEGQAEEIHLAALEILSRTGILVEHEGARNLLARHGAAVRDDRVRIPPGLVKRALANAPERVVLYDRRDRPAVDLSADRSYFGTGSDTPTYYDPYTRQLRKTDRESVKTFARLCDALENIDFVMSMGIAAERPGTSSFVHQFAAMLEGTVKPAVFTAQGLKDIAPIYEIALAAAGGDGDLLRMRPRCLLYTEPVSPLVLTRKAVEMTLFCAEKGMPMTCPTGMMCGATGPVTLAGSIALGNAETLAALTIQQLAAPGAPFVYGGNVSVMDMRTGLFTYGAPEFHLAFAAFADMGRFYRLPVWGLAGASDAKTLDAQAAAEAAYELLLARLSGSNLVHDVGYLNTGLTASMEMIVLCDELIGMMERIAAGIEVNERTLALDVIDQVGPRGSFLETEHTRTYFRDSIWRPRLFERRGYEAWKAAGAEDLFERLNRRVREILDSHRPDPLPAK
ncbi:MAG: trimethylamine methyltransferase family protein, partial [Planctomycetota bacterium]|nr:trimethylamine methyltransferase family protein [Planctomycetota bacterium]